MNHAPGPPALERETPFQRWPDANEGRHAVASWDLNDPMLMWTIEISVDADLDYGARQSIERKINAVSAALDRIVHGEPGRDQVLNGISIRR